ncbi:MAG: deoxyribodipyrimidine photo-lyase [Planctomycetales bacterium]|nr:deoxyribodipyrimidine photo-lyase [Planctomycetales bacterium]
MPSADAVFWFRRDLRLADNPALVAAIRIGRIVPLFIWDPSEEGDWPTGSASRWWLHRSLSSLDAQLRKVGSRLVIRRGPALKTLQALLGETGARYVGWNRRYEPALIAVDREIKTQLQAMPHVEATSGNGSLLLEPWEVATQSGGPYRVFTPFWRRCLELAPRRDLSALPESLEPPDRWPASVDLDDLKLNPTIDWDAGFRGRWSPGEEGAQRQLAHFVSQTLATYADSRDRVDIEGSSQLSPHLRFGELSPQQVWDAVENASGLRANSSPACTSFLSEIGWREFAYHALYHFPQMTNEPLREAFKQFPWQPRTDWIAAWRRGTKGIPIVDAAMRHLWHEGWMPNRARMIVASLLTKNLLVPWQVGAEWFWDTLVDADLANNSLNWQWTAGCGVDAAPFFRIFNPVTQAEKFDPDGAYVRRWVPELARLETPWLFKPWAAGAERLRQAGVKLGRDYPAPIVDLQESRRQALAAYETLSS